MKTAERKDFVRLFFFRDQLTTRVKVIGASCSRLPGVAVGRNVQAAAAIAFTVVAEF